MSLLDPLLDATVLFSFDRTGFQRHARRFDPADLPRTLRGRTVLITGGSAGIGLAAAEGLARLQANLVLVARDPDRLAEAAAQLRDLGAPEVHTASVDLADLRAAAAFARGWTAPLDVILHNAGALPTQRQTTPTGHDLTVALHLLTPILLNRLLPLAERARVIWITSGGMYTQRLRVDALQRSPEPYDGVVAYAQTKRAQVIWMQQEAEQLQGRAFLAAMHPGWADTDGVKASLPRFRALTRAILRTPAEGADTMLWLAATERPLPTGQLWFDRQTADLYPVPRTRESDAERQRLLRWLEGEVQPFLTP